MACGSRVHQGNKLSYIAIPILSRNLPMKPPLSYIESGHNHPPPPLRMSSNLGHLQQQPGHNYSHPWPGVHHEAAGAHPGPIDQAGHPQNRPSWVMISLQDFISISEKLEEMNIHWPVHPYCHMAEGGPAGGYQHASPQVHPPPVNAALAMDRQQPPSVQATPYAGGHYYNMALPMMMNTPQPAFYNFGAAPAHLQPAHHQPHPPAANIQAVNEHAHRDTAQPVDNQEPLQPRRRRRRHRRQIQPYTEAEEETILSMMDAGRGPVSVANVLEGRTANAIQAKYWRMKGGDPRGAEKSRKKAAEAREDAASMVGTSGQEDESDR
ncbi:hypothetical protein M406DRAFT_67055 [Cryphonectria parasitica EP155]|uniref:Myb-like domain-containing protein n=1 Tax=Cryphonectria parasitica (strain ATCC 38755 / EP155) TaxID=660469 RepID=A0A9P5CUH6_CRYP1|nr:uncharacterized protein M406DRAFT_67055 [Cryphonectria parasitica EP155]KAF3770672.1 hypothetical protein M406DRAFT_67055 [Cryphonectria parasitica EP155]